MICFLGTVLGGTICLYGVDNMVVNAAGFCVVRERFRWSYSRKMWRHREFCANSYG